MNCTFGARRSLRLHARAAAHHGRTGRGTHTELRRRERRHSAAIELFDALSEWLELSLVTAVSRTGPIWIDCGSLYASGKPKSETSRLREFAEYLEYFEQAGGKIDLEQEGGDAVQLMTVHAAQGAGV